jgi:predicted amidohydrolase YtcJ
MSSLLNQDVVVSLHSDTPVGIPSPLLELWVAGQPHRCVVRQDACAL